MQHFYLIAVLTLFAGYAYGQGTQVEANINSLSFSSIIGGPLSAAVAAQASAAAATLQYVQEMGFTKSNGVIDKPVYFTFYYEALNASDQQSNFTFSVPLLALLPIPFLRVDTINIDFKAKIQGVNTASYSTTAYGADSSWFGGYSGGWQWGWNYWNYYGAVASQSYQRTNAGAQYTTNDFQLDISVRAGFEDSPPGMTRMLSLFESLIRDRLIA